MYLIQVGYGRPGRFDGFDKIYVDQASFEKAQALPDEWDEEDFDSNASDKACTVAALLIKTETCDGLYLEALEKDPRVIKAMDEWTILPSGPILDVHTILFWAEN